MARSSSRRMESSASGTRAAAVHLLSGQQVEQPQPQVDRRLTQLQRPLSHARDDAGLPFLVKARRVRRLPNQHESPPFERLPGVAADRRDRFVREANGAVQPLDQPRVTVEAVGRGRALRRRRHRLRADGSRPLGMLLGGGGAPLRVRQEGKRPLLRERAGDRRPHRRMVDARHRQRRRQAAADPDDFRGAGHHAAPAETDSRRMALPR